MIFISMFEMTKRTTLLNYAHICRLSDVPEKVKLMNLKINSYNYQQVKKILFKTID